MTILYAWARPAFFSQSPVDHTWVTNYDNHLDQNPNDSDYWYCWGDFHTPNSPAPRLLGNQNGTLDLARCLVQSNVPSTTNIDARGTIFSYGKDGVCHQLANQVLYATGGRQHPLTVFGARGYPKSLFIYGTYGLQQQQAWNVKSQFCTTRYPMGVHPMSEQPDNFKQYARQFITNEQQLNGLLQLREDRQHALFNMEAATANDINEGNQYLLDRAAELLGNQLFEKVFGTPPDDRTNLVNPEILETMNEINAINEREADL